MKGIVSSDRCGIVPKHGGCLLLNAAVRYKSIFLSFPSFRCQFFDLFPFHFTFFLPTQSFFLKSTGQYFLDRISTLFVFVFVVIFVSSGTNPANTPF